jgi:glycosyltransferase involved in cell wall biosynthesis
MSGDVRPCVVVPVFDNASTVADVVTGAAEHVDLVVVVDDGSRDGSGAAARAARVRHGAAVDVVTLPANRGKGAALLAGFRRAAELGRTHAVTMDADAQHRASDLPAFLAAARSHPLAIVVGAREMDNDRVPNAARVGRRVSNFWTLRSTGFDLPDTTCGFRVYPIAQVLDLPAGTRHYDFEGEVLVRGAWAGLELRSLPIDVWYPADRAERVSHYRPWADSVRITVMYVHLALRRLLPMGGAGRAVRGVRPPRTRLRDTLRQWRALAASGTQVNELALAIGVGVFLGATPLWGLHAPLTLYIAVRWRLNLVAAFLATNISFPLVAPALVFAEIQFGHLLRRGEWLDLRQEEFTVASAWSHATDYLVGGFSLAALLGIAAGLATLKFGAMWRRRRAALAGAVGTRTA